MTDETSSSSTALGDEAGDSASDGRSGANNRRIVHRALVLLVGGIGIYVVLPKVLSAVTEWQSLSEVVWSFVVLAVACEAASFASIWQLDRMLLRAKAWFPVITTQLTSAAASRILPAGGATSVALVVSMLRRADINTTDGAAAWETSSLLQTITTLALPVLALPAILVGVPVDHGLTTAAILGGALFALLTGVGAIAFATDAPIRLVGSLLQRFLNVTVRRHDHIADLPNRLLHARDSVLAALGSQWKGAILAAAGSTLFDYLALLVALRAVGADPRPSLVLLAYTGGQMLGLVAITPGGLGFVESGLIGMLKLAGVPVGDAVAATLVYRAASYWLPLPAGGIAYLLFRRRYSGGGVSLSAGASQPGCAGP
jgi:uncharacterized protein (TIRG00374 family)